MLKYKNALKCTNTFLIGVRQATVGYMNVFKLRYCKPSPWLLCTKEISSIL